MVSSTTTRTEDTATEAHTAMVSAKGIVTNASEWMSKQGAAEHDLINSSKACTVHMTGSANWYNNRTYHSLEHLICRMHQAALEEQQQKNGYQVQSVQVLKFL